jgi:flavin reductase (DIM6/NTAB) family NADH-FMN oxidoreductase RutF
VLTAFPERTRCLPDTAAGKRRRVENDSRFHELTAAIDYPMFLVTAAADGERTGCLVGFTTQCSISPPRYVVCISERNHTFRIARGAEVLGVHLVEADHRQLAELFGSTTGDEVDKFASCRWEEGPHGVPLLSDLRTRFLGRVVDRVDSGDHLALFVDVVEADVGGEVRPLTFQQLRHLEPGHGA